MPKYQLAPLQSKKTTKNLDTVLLFSHMYSGQQASTDAPNTVARLASLIEHEQNQDIESALDALQEDCIRAVQNLEIFDDQQKANVLDVLFTNPAWRKYLVYRNLNALLCPTAFAATCFLAWQAAVAEKDVAKSLIYIFSGVSFTTLFAEEASRAHKNLSLGIAESSYNFAAWLENAASVLSQEYAHKPIRYGLVNVETAIPLSAEEQAKLDILANTVTSKVNCSFSSNPIMNLLDYMAIALYKELKNNVMSFTSDVKVRADLEKILQFMHRSGRQHAAILNNATEFFLELRKKKEPEKARDEQEKLFGLLQIYVGLAITNHINLSPQQTEALRTKNLDNPLGRKYCVIACRLAILLLACEILLIVAQTVDMDNSLKTSLTIVSSLGIVASSASFLIMYNRSSHKINESFNAAKYWLHDMAQEIDNILEVPLAQELNNPGLKYTLGRG